ncbi:MAG: cobalt ECF transporter T component CbiQ [Nitrospirota bacterium]
MLNFDKEFFNIGHLDALSYKKTFIHQINPGIKLVVTLFFIVTVVSFSKYDVRQLIPFFLFPVFVMSAGDIPAAVVLKKLLVVSPFVLFAGLFNPLFDTSTAYTVSGINVSRGWVSYISLIIKFILTISSAVLLIATTSFPGICYALEKMRVPRIFVMQLLFIYRYLFVLAEEAMRIVRARNMRTFGKQGSGIKPFINIVSIFLLRSIERSERIYHAICARGFDGRIRLLKNFSIGIPDVLFAVLSVSAFLMLRIYDVTELIGEAALKH